MNANYYSTTPQTHRYPTPPKPHPYTVAPNFKHILCVCVCLVLEIMKVFFYSLS